MSLVSKEKYTTGSRGNTIKTQEPPMEEADQMTSSKDVKIDEEETAGILVSLSTSSPTKSTQKKNLVLDFDILTCPSANKLVKCLEIPSIGVSDGRDDHDGLVKNDDGVICRTISASFDSPMSISNKNSPRSSSSSLLGKRKPPPSFADHCNSKEDEQSEQHQHNNYSPSLKPRIFSSSSSCSMPSPSNIMFPFSTTTINQKEIIRNKNSDKIIQLVPQRVFAISRRGGRGRGRSLHHRRH